MGAAVRRTGALQRDDEPNTASLRLTPALSPWAQPFMWTVTGLPLPQTQGASLKGVALTSASLLTEKPHGLDDEGCGFWCCAEFPHTALRYGFPQRPNEGCRIMNTGE